jgi:hypothetical protein
MSFPFLAATTDAVSAAGRLGDESGNQEIGFRVRRWRQIGQAIQLLRGVPAEGLLTAIAYVSTADADEGAAILMGAEEGGLVYGINRCLTSAAIAGYGENAGLAAASARMWRGSEPEPDEVVSARESLRPIFGGATGAGGRTTAPVDVVFTAATCERASAVVYWLPEAAGISLWQELNLIRSRFTGSDVRFTVRLARREAAMVIGALLEADAATTAAVVAHEAFPGERDLLEAIAGMQAPAGS